VAFGVYRYVTSDDQSQVLGDRLEELTQQVEELQKHQALVAQRLFRTSPIQGRQDWEVGNNCKGLSHGNGEDNKANCTDNIEEGAQQ